MMTRTALQSRLDDIASRSWPHSDSGDRRFARAINSAWSEYRTSRRRAMWVRLAQED